MTGNKRIIKAVVFDLDDTLYPELDYVKSGYRAVERAVQADFGVPCCEQLLAAFFENKLNVFQRTLPALGIPCPPEYVQKLVEVYRCHAPDNLKLYDDVAPALSALKARKIRTGIITDGRVDGQEAKLRALNCYRLFESVVITDSLGGEAARKPNPISYERTAENLATGFAETVYVGDNPHKDFAVKKVHPIFTVRVLRENGVKDIDPSAPDYCAPDVTIGSLAELEELLF